ncbi:hypothetical protein ACSS6W_001760 [Trichoderma asperelloides]
MCQANTCVPKQPKFQRNSSQVHQNESTIKKKKEQSRGSSSGIEKKITGETSV